MGMQAAFVLSGKYPEQSVIDSLPTNERPDVIADSVAGLLEQTLLDIGGKGTRT
jgi:hypothetical protein